MTLALVMILLALGVAWSQAISSQHAVTLRWLRLCDLIGMVVLSIAGTIVLIERTTISSAAFAAMAGVVAFLYGSFIVHLILVQLGRRDLERVVIVAACGISACALVFGGIVFGKSSGFPLAVPFAQESGGQTPPANSPAWGIPMIGLAQVLSSFLLGGSLMTMLLGHAYLTAGGEMTQQPFLRLTRAILAVIACRTLLAVLVGALPWWMQIASGHGPDHLAWPTMLVITRFVVGLFVPFVMTWMAYRCVLIRSNQSATGILYVGSLMLLIGEITSVSLWSETHLAF